MQSILHLNSVLSRDTIWIFAKAVTFEWFTPNCCINLNGPFKV